MKFPEDAIFVTDTGFAWGAENSPELASDPNCTMYVPAGKPECVEIMRPINHDEPELGWLMIKALTAARKNNIDVQVVPNGHGTSVDVELRINGVQVPFVETMKACFTVTQQAIERRAQQLSEQCILDLGLTELQFTIAELERSVKSELQNRVSEWLTKNKS